MTEWFRSWHGAPTDPKWLVVARKAGTIPAIVSAVVWALFDYASQQEDRGEVRDFDVETYAAVSGLDEELVHKVIAALTSKGIIADYRLTNWEKRQPQREDNSTGRVRSMRERNAMKRNETLGNAPEERREDTDKNRVTPSLRSGVTRTPKDELVEVLDDTRATAVVEHRKKIKRPLTTHAAHLLAMKLAKAPDANVAADAMIANGWQGFEPEWLANRGTGPPKQTMSAKLSALCDQPVEQTIDDFTRSLHRSVATRVS